MSRKSAKCRNWEKRWAERRAYFVNKINFIQLFIAKTACETYITRAENLPENRIVHGTEAETNEFPWMVSFCIYFFSVFLLNI